MTQDEISRLNETFAGRAPEALLKYFLDRYGDRIALS